MAKRKSEEDPFHDYNEWINHRYNPYYFINKISLPTRAFWNLLDRHPRITAAFMVLFYAPALIVFVLEFFRDIRGTGMPFLQLIGENPYFIVGFFPILFLTVVVVGYAIHFFRAPQEQASEEPERTRNRKKPSKKDRIPKRRKDYQ